MNLPINSITDKESENPPNVPSDGAITIEAVTDDVPIVALGRKKRFMLIDETKLPPEEAERLLVKRAYNRECAERARKRGKDLVHEMHRQIVGLQEDKNELRRTLAVMEKELKQLQEEKKVLLSMNAVSFPVDDIIPSLIPPPCYINNSVGTERFNGVTNATANRFTQAPNCRLPSIDPGNHIASSSLQSLDYDTLLLLLQQFRK